jgi:beta-lactamase class A
MILFSLMLMSLFPTEAPKNALSTNDLRIQIEHIISRYEGDFAVAYINLEDASDTLFIHADELFHAASTMKTPVMIEAYKQAAAGRFNLSDSLLVRNEFSSIVDGSPFSLDVSRDGGEAFYSTIGQRVLIRDIIYDMITVSGNLATNVMIDLLDARAVTATMREMGAARIDVLRGVEDMKAFQAGLSNRTTARDLAIIFEHIAQGTAVSAQASADMTDILLDQKFRDMIPAGLPSDVRVAHKTGSITGVNHDSGIVILPDGRRYVLVVLSKNLTQNADGVSAGVEISRAVYSWFTNP